MMRRREFLMLGGYAAAAVALQGCSIIEPKPCPNFGCDLPNSETPLLIDVHVHLFNAADLQVEGYITAMGRAKNGPLKEVLETAGEVLQVISWESAPGFAREIEKLEALEKSITQWGAVGVKLYPPMGFSLGANKMFDGLWREYGDFLAPSVRDLIAQEDFGERLNTCLTKLYQYCADAQIPVMIHSNRSNFSHDAFDDLINPPLWNHALKKNNVYSCYAHLCGAGNKAIDCPNDARQFVRGMNQPQSRQFADTSYFSDIIGSSKDIKRMTKKLETLFEQTFEDQSRFGQLMYGTDWKMILIEKGSKTYLKNFNDILTNLQSRHPEWHMEDETPGLMGLNAAR